VRNVVVLTGAGISVASGLRPFRGPGGLWEDDAQPSSGWTRTDLDDDPEAIWSFFQQLRTQAEAAEPNAAHRALAAFEQAHEGEVTLITQNVDGLHVRAGSQNVLELHGSLTSVKCTACDFQAKDPSLVTATACPRCPRCGAPQRPGVVLFGEPLPAHEEHMCKRALRDVDWFIAVGTSGTVSPASNFVRSAKYVGAKTTYVNLTPMTPSNDAFDEVVLGKAEEVLADVLSLTA